MIYAIIRLGAGNEGQDLFRVHVALNFQFQETLVMSAGTKSYGTELPTRLLCRLLIINYGRSRLGTLLLHFQN